MSFYVIAAMTDWIIHTDLTPIKEVCEKPHDERKEDPRLIKLAEELRTRWANGSSKPHRLATLGWKPEEAVNVLSLTIENIDRIRAEYKEEVERTGKTPRLSQTDDNYPKIVETMILNNPPPPFNPQGYNK